MCRNLPAIPLETVSWGQFPLEGCDSAPEEYDISCVQGCMGKETTVVSTCMTAHKRPWILDMCMCKPKSVSDSGQYYVPIHLYDH